MQIVNYGVNLTILFLVWHTYKVYVQWVLNIIQCLVGIISKERRQPYILLTCLVVTLLVCVFRFFIC